MKNHDHKWVSKKELREQSEAVVNLILEYIHTSSVPETIKWLSPEDQLAFWQSDFNDPNKATPSDLFQKVIDHNVNLHSAKYMGHQVGVTHPITVLSNAVIAGLSQGMAVYEMGMAGNAMEKVVTTYLAREFGFGDEAAGIITSGGSLANLTALLTARSYFEEEDFHHLTIMVSGESHYSVARAAAIMGLPGRNIIRIPVNDKFQMRTDLLDDSYQKAIAGGRKVLAIVACSCSTAVGAYDDLHAIGDWAAKNNVWFHVDGAHGAAVVYSSRYKHLISGIGKADSVIMDYHKLLMTPSLTTAVIYKNGADARRTFAQKADYLFTDKSEDDWYNGGKRTVECTRPMSILNVYAMLRIYGKELFEQNIDTLYQLSRDFAEIISQHRNFELALTPQSNIVCFRYKTEGDSNALNKKIAEAVLHDGEFYIVNTVINGTFWLRATIQNPRTTPKELRRLLDHIIEIKNRLFVNPVSDDNCHQPAKSVQSGIS